MWATFAKIKFIFFDMSDGPIQVRNVSSGFITLHLQLEHKKKIGEHYYITEILQLNVLNINPANNSLPFDLRSLYHIFHH